MVTVAVMLPVLLLLASIAINLAYIQVIHAKVQIVTDAAARAAGRVYVESGSKQDALAAAQHISSQNPIHNVVVPISAADLEFGLSQRKTKDQAYTFEVAEAGNSVRLTTDSFAAGAGSSLHALLPGLTGSFEIRPRCTATNTQTTLDVAVIVDRSGSMAFAADEPTGGTPIAAPEGWNYGDPVPPNSRWLDLVASVNGFCDELSQTAKVEKVGLVSYANEATREIDLTDDYSLINACNAQISYEFNGGRTNVGDGILQGIAGVTHPTLARPWANNALVLMSDGNHNIGTDPLLAASEAANQQIPIYTVSFSEEADQVLMQQIADMTGGTHYHAVDGAQLNEAFRNIARRLPSMLTQ
ncbi:von Willebrand factor type A domain protein [Novipirellula artificiosorum]|uniref:von Willebrand factor type A domain protein n=2 Tax=Novipirellula artificiosorum TaxID=2528016 RepID=A0A5C6DEC3_9BACT|nr:von Willebrand factor type A domain protein [Novipirellula artificiosorum]